MIPSLIRGSRRGVRGVVHFAILAALAGGIASEARAELLQIIHTNDLHSYFEHSQNERLGGYAALKRKIDELRAEARSQGIATVVLDAGDFGDGSPMYLARRGEVSWNMMNALDYDAVVLGNHDYLPGMTGLDRIVGNIRPEFALLGANFIPAKGEKNLQRYLKPYFETERGGLRIAVLGITNSEFAYRWRVGARTIRPMMEAADRYLPDLRARNDVVIALTHIGTNKDVRLVGKSRGIDVVIGGHTHEFLREPVMARDRDGREVPIVQAGEHGEAVGDLLVDIQPGMPAQVLRYQLHPVLADGPKDEAVAEAVRQARETFESEYGRDWLHEVVGHTAVPLHGPSREEQRGGTDLVLHSIRDAIDSDLALDNQEFYGNPIPPGPITREKIFGFYPRIFDFVNLHGWTVWEVKVQGWGLTYLMDTALQGGYMAHILGATYDVVTDKKGKLHIKNVRINGEKIKTMKIYTVAMPEGLARWAHDATWFIQHVVARDLTDSGVTIWQAVENRLKKQGVVTSEIQ